MARPTYAAPELGAGLQHLVGSTVGRGRIGPNQAFNDDSAALAGQLSRWAEFNG